jgi:hypothetical protein
LHDLSLSCLLLQFEAMDQKLGAQLTKLFEARRRRAMLLGFAEAPVAMLNAAIAAAVRNAQHYAVLSSAAFLQGCWHCWVLKAWRQAALLCYHSCPPPHVCM